MVPCPYDSKYYDAMDLLDLIEEGFYDDYDPYDNLEVQRNFPQLGSQECLDALLDLGGGDFDVEQSSPGNHGRKGIIDIDGEFTSVGNLGNGLWKVGSGCNGCTGCNVKIEKSRIKNKVKELAEKNE